MKNLMERAWEIAREAVVRFGGKASQYIGEALRMAWADLKGSKKAIVDRIEELEALGFKRWTKNGMDRLYINANALGLVCRYYKTGNIKEAWFDGQMTSNRWASKAKAAKTFIDIKTGKVYSDLEELKAACARIAAI